MHKRKVGVATEVYVNAVQITSDTDFKTIKPDLAYNAAGLALVWNFTNAATGEVTQTAVTLTNTGNYCWNSKSNGMYTVSVPASGGASINNNAAGFGFFTGGATGYLSFRGPTYEFLPASVYDALVTGTTNLPASVAAYATGKDPATLLGKRGPWDRFFEFWVTSTPPEGGYAAGTTIPAIRYLKSSTLTSEGLPAYEAEGGALEDPLIRYAWPAGGQAWSWYIGPTVGNVETASFTLANGSGLQVENTEPIGTWLLSNGALTGPSSVVSTAGVQTAFATNVPEYVATQEDLGATQTNIIAQLTGDGVKVAPLTGLGGFPLALRGADFLATLPGEQTGNPITVTGESLAAEAADAFAGCRARFVTSAGVVTDYAVTHSEPAEGLQVLTLSPTPGTIAATTKVGLYRQATVAGQTSILSGLSAIAAVLTGITSLPKWLRPLFSKGTPDATALGEINTGGGTYDPATDSLEAAAERATVIKAKTDTIGTGVVHVQSPVNQDGDVPQIRIIRGNDHVAAHGNSIDFEDTDGILEDLTSATITLTVRKADDVTSEAELTATGAVVPGSDPVILRFELAAEDTLAMTPTSGYSAPFDVVVEYADHKIESFIPAGLAWVQVNVTGEQPAAAPDPASQW